ncbi:MAG: hypothetical protein K6G12_06015 [Lachnospiraceae bacterium]|nr:hypothetical protein [Lachnospiraceae bacterium]
MKTLVLSIRMIRKRIISLLILSAEIIISVVVLLTFSSEIDHIIRARNIAYSIVSEDNYYFSTYWCYFLQHRADIRELLPDQYRDKVLFGSSSNCPVYTKTGYLNAIIYSDLVLENMGLLDHFEAVADKDTKVISAVSFGNGPAAGEEFALETGETIRITASLGNQEYLPFFSGTSSPDILVLEKYVQKVEGKGIILRESDLDHSVNAGMTDSFIIRIKEENAQLKDEILHWFEGYGQVVSLDKMKTNYLRENRVDLFTNVTMFVIFAITVAMGIYGVNCMWAEKNSKNYTIMFICGMNRRTNLILEVLATAAVFLLSFGVVVATYDTLISSFIPFDIGNNKMLYCALIFTYFFAVYLYSSLEPIRRATKHNLIELYKRNTNEDRS